MKHPFVVAVKCEPTIDSDLLMAKHFEEWMEMFPSSKGKSVSGLGEWGFAHYAGFGIFTFVVDIADEDLPHAELMLVGLSTFELSQLRIGNLIGVPQVQTLLDAQASICGELSCRLLVKPHHAIVVMENAAKTFMFNYQAHFDFQKGVRPDTVH